PPAPEKKGRPSILSLLCDAPPGVLQKLRRNSHYWWGPGCLRGSGRTLSPTVDHKNDEQAAGGQIDCRHGPRQPPNSAVRGLNQRHLPEFLHKPLHDQVIRIAARDSLIDFLQHTLRGTARAGECAAHVVTRRGRVVAS